MADALASGASVRKDVGVQVPPSRTREKVLISKEFSTFFFFLNFRLGFLTTNRQQNRLLPDAAQPLWAANRKRRSVRSVFLRSILSVADRVLDQRRDAEAMAVPILLRRLRIGKVHMPAAAHIDRAAGAAVELMEMVFIEIRAEAHLLHMVAVPSGIASPLTVANRWLCGSVFSSAISTLPTISCTWRCGRLSQPHIWQQFTSEKSIANVSCLVFGEDLLPRSILCATMPPRALVTALRPFPAFPA